MIRYQLASSFRNVSYTESGFLPRGLLGAHALGWGFDHLRLEAFYARQKVVSLYKLTNIRVLVNYVKAIENLVEIVKMKEWEG